MQVSWKVIVVVSVVIIGIIFGLGYYAATSAARAKQLKSAIEQLQDSISDLKRRESDAVAAKHQAESDYLNAVKRVEELRKGIEHLNAELSGISGSIGVSINAQATAIERIRTANEEFELILEKIRDRAEPV